MPPRGRAARLAKATTVAAAKKAINGEVILTQLHEHPTKWIPDTELLKGSMLGPRSYCT